MMNHLPFENWLLDDIDLSDEQKQMLQSHLRECNRCMDLKDRWLQVDRRLQSVQTTSPADGFSARWKAGLDARWANLHHQQVHRWLFILSVLGLLTFSLIMINILRTTSLMDWLFAAFDTVSGFFDWWDQLRQALFSVFALFPPFVSMILTILIVSMLCVLTLVWILSLWRIYRRGNYMV